MKIPVLILFMAFSSGYRPTPALENAVKLYEKGEYKQALNLLVQLRGKVPEDPEVRLWTGKSYLKIHEWESAIRELEKTVELQPANARNHLWLGRALGARAAHAIFFKAAGLARRVVESFEKARELSPDNVEVRFDLIEYYLNAPGIMGGGKDKAKNEAEVIARLNNKLGYTARAAILMKDKRWEEAKKELLQATLDYPKDPDTHKDLAGYLLDREDFAGALNYATKALALDPDSKQTRLILAAAQTRLKTNLDEATKTLAALASGPLSDADPSFQDVYYWLGECHFARGDKTRALEAFTSALVFDPWHENAKKQVSRLR